MTAASKIRTRGSITSTPSGDILTLAGDIDDTAALGQYVPNLRNHVTIDLGGVTFINSVGVREWITLLDMLAQRGTRVMLRNVSEPMVRQLTMVMEARGDAGIESFFAPYTCPKCGDERALLIDVAQHQATLIAQRPPALPCAVCGTPSELDEFPKRYFSFLG